MLDYEDKSILHFGIHNDIVRRWTISNAQDRDIWVRLSRTHMQCQCINRGHVLTKTKQHVKYESSVINGFQDNMRKLSYFVFTKVTHVTLTFDLVNPKSIGALSSLSMWNMKAMWSTVFKTVLSSGYILILLSIEYILASLIEMCQGWSRMRNVK